MKLRKWNTSNLGMSNWCKSYVFSPVVHYCKVCFLGLLPAVLHVSVGDCINSKGRISSAGSVWLSFNKLLFHLTLLSKNNPSPSKLLLLVFYFLSLMWLCLNVCTPRLMINNMKCIYKLCVQLQFRSQSYKCPFEVLSLCWGVHL